MKSLQIAEAVGLVCLKLFIYSTIQSSVVTSLEANIFLELNFQDKPSLFCGNLYDCVPMVTSASSLMSKQVTGLSSIPESYGNNPQMLHFNYSILTNQLDIIPLAENVTTTVTLYCPEGCHFNTSEWVAVDQLKLFQIPFKNDSVRHSVTFMEIGFPILQVKLTIEYSYWPDPLNSHYCSNGIESDNDKCPSEAKFYCPIFADDIVTVPCCPAKADDSCIESVDTTTSTSSITTTSSTSSITTTSSTSSITTTSSASSITTTSSASSIPTTSSASSIPTTTATSNTTSSNTTETSATTNDSSYRIATIVLAIITGALMIVVIVMSVLLIRLRKKSSKSSSTVNSAPVVDNRNHEYPQRAPNVPGRHYDAAKHYYE